MAELFTIGHSNHTADHVVGLLRQHQIGLVADVRSVPHSQYTPQFNRNALEGTFRRAAIDYVFLGNELGARRAEEICYVEGQARYDKIAPLPAFRRGLQRIAQESRARRVSLLCSEADPLTCHRTILVCRELKKIEPGLSVVHILGDGGTETQEASEERLIALHKLVPELFGELSSREGLVERAYDLQAGKIAYTSASADA